MQLQEVSVKPLLEALAVPEFQVAVAVLPQLSLELQLVAQVELV
jgi:hypothetical protein